MIVFIYVVLLFLVLRFTVTLFNFLSNPKLGHYGKKFSDRVSVIMESDNYANSEFLAKQEYNNIEILYVEQYGSVQAAIENATGKYLLFLDVGLAIQKGFINSLIYRMKVFDLALLSVIPNKKLFSLKDRLLGPLPEYLLISLLPLRLVRIFNLPSFSSANKRCLFFDRDLYMQNNWHQELAERGWSVSKMSRLVKERKLNAEILLANKLLYNSKPVNISSFARETFQHFDASVPGTILYLIMVMVGPLVMFLNFEMAFLLLPLSLIFLSRIMISFLTTQNALINVLLHPLQMLILTYLLCKGLFMYFCRIKYFQIK
ncbi:MAG: hypothetical protein EOO92_02835 [Pedobacter sp.]|nr:MAG: hypothetical protein EOO92_02835 [Pedobacter sp.]